MRSATSPEQPLSYYGQPIIKEPVWKPEIPFYLFTGGMAGGTALLAAGARVTGNPELARTATFVNMGAIGVSPLLLISDLGRPLRFYNMLRVVKPSSPMNVGTWIVTASGAASSVAFGCELLRVFPRLRVAAEWTAAALAPFLSTYTAVLVSDSVVPVWHDARRWLPFEFAASAAAAAGGAVAMLAPVEAAAPARRLGILGGIAEIVVAKSSERALGTLTAEPYHRGKASRFSKLATACALGGAAVTALAGRRRLGALLGGALLCAGSACQRFAVIEAGRISARDPKYTTLPQRERAAEHGQRAQKH